MKIEMWEDGKEQYILNDEFVLKRADKLEFGIHETIYSGVDLELSYSWKKQTIDKIDYEDHFWIYYNKTRIGGVHIKPNLMGAFFMEPPYLVDRFRVINVLNDALLQWKCEEKIRVYGVLPSDIENYNRLGYKVSCERKVMIRPTETFDSINWGDDFFIKVPTINDAEELGKMFVECYTGGVDYEVFGQQNVEEAIENAKYILNIYKSNNILDGSTLVYDKTTNELVGACIAGINGFTDNNFSEIGEIVVKPSYRGNGIASNLIKQALNNLNKISQATILCVTVGNSAEAVYHKMGFMQGVKFANMFLK